MAQIKIRGISKIEFSDDKARLIKSDWIKMKEGKLSPDTIITVGEFTGSISLVEAFIIEPERYYPLGLAEHKETPEERARIREKFEEIKKQIKRI